MTIQVEKLRGIEVASTGDYAPIWQAILETPKDGTPYRIVGSEKWSVERLEKVRAAIRGRFVRSGLPWKLHLMRGPGFFFWWETDTEETSSIPRHAAQAIEQGLQEGILWARPYRRRKSLTYRERIERKKRRRLLQNLGRMPDEEDHRNPKGLW